MGINPLDLRKTAWVFALIFAVLGIILLLFMFALSAPPWSLGDILLTLLGGGSYITGLLIGKKWPLAGGILSFILPIAAVVMMVVTFLRVESDSGILGYLSMAIIMYLIMMIPGSLYLLSWHLQRKLDQKASTGEPGN